MLYKKINIFAFVLGIFALFSILINTPEVSAQTDGVWSTLAGNPQRTSHVNGASNRVPGELKPVWYKPIDAYIDNKVQTIVGSTTINGIQTDVVFLATSVGLYAFNANNGTQLWVYGTEMPLGHTPTFYAPNNTVYVGGFDHKIHAIDASTGLAKSGWTFSEAGAGFDTNPLVVSDSSTGNQPIVFAGNRDGYFYAFDGNNGSLKWRYQTDGPIKFSAAYKGGVVYFASDDSHAYALQLANNGASNTLKWKKGPFSGVGFDMYWPVIYTDSATNTDYVIFSSSIKAGGWWFEGNIDMYRKSTEAMFSSVSGYCGPTGNSNNSDSSNPRNYNWVTGTRVIECNAVYNYYQSNPQQVFVHILNRDTGNEYTPYAPFNVAGHDGGGQGYKQPPIVGGDNVIYQRIAFVKGGNGAASGNIVGWKFGTRYISDLNNDVWASDEPAVFTSGGDGNNTLVYYGEGSFNHEGFGTVNPAGTYGSNVVQWHWNLNKPGATDKYTTLGLNGKFKAAGVTGESSYSYMDGVLNFSPVPYKNKVYLINGNTLFALSPSGTASSALSNALVPPSRVPANISTSKDVIRQKLADEIQKMLSAGHLRPGFHDSHQVSQAMTLGYPGYFTPGNQLMVYFHNPGDTVTVLSQALSLPDADVPANLKSSIRTYLQTHYGPSAPYSISQYANIGWSGGALRENYADTQDINNVFSQGTNYYTPTNKQGQICCQASERASLSIGNYPPESLYAGWQYALKMNLSQSQSLSLFNAMRGRLPTPGSGNGMSDSNLMRYPYILNQYIAGYKGYIELAKLAGIPSNDSDFVTKQTKYNSLLALRLLDFNTNYKDSPYPDDFDALNALNISRNFMFLTPELASEMRNSRLSQIQTALTEYNKLTPYWFVSKYNRSYGESYSLPLYDYNALFQAKAYVLQDPFTELVKYIDIPAFTRGDLFYIQNLVAALQAPGDGVPTSPTASPPPTPGDTNNDGDVDGVDYVVWLTHYNQSATPNNYSVGNFNNDSVVDGLDYVIWLNNYNG